MSYSLKSNTKNVFGLLVRLRTERLNVLIVAFHPYKGFRGGNEASGCSICSESFLWKETFLLWHSCHWFLPNLPPTQPEDHTHTTLLPQTGHVCVIAAGQTVREWLTTVVVDAVKGSLINQIICGCHDEQFWHVVWSHLDTAHWAQLTLVHVILFFGPVSSQVWNKVCLTFSATF